MSRFRQIALGILLVFILLILLAGSIGCYLAFYDHGINYDFDPQKVAASETRMWKFYYTGQGEDLGWEMVSIMREQMGVSFLTAAAVVEPMARGTMIFARAEGNYETTVLPKLEEAYANLAKACNTNWDARELAKAELDWWEARRSPDTYDPAIVGAKIAHLYALLYGQTNPQIERAGLLRAQAAALRDEGGPNADWPAIEQMLVESYTTLRDGIQSGRS
ncbi:MAG TPA: hypothetical protein PLI09_03660 [Candidatus Hydrogenedentes bacterium]|nr:hypothetical protein [Candidatus Hydrogenedentota bacterium]